MQSGDFVNAAGMNANSSMTFYGQEKVEYNAKLCLMNMAVHGLTGVIKSGDEANTFYHDAHNLNGCCDYIMANPPFNVDKVKAESCENAGRLPFGLPSVNKNKEVGNANYLWISYFYSYLNEHGRAGFVMASSATDSQGKDKDIREALIRTGHVDVMISVGNNYFYTKSLPCSLWFFDKAKSEAIRGKVLFIDARNYYTVVDRTLNEWSEWQLKNLNAIVWLYRGETEKYKALLNEYENAIQNGMKKGILAAQDLCDSLPNAFAAELSDGIASAKTKTISRDRFKDLFDFISDFRLISDYSEGNAIKSADSMTKDQKTKLALARGFKTYKEYEKRLEILAGVAAQNFEELKSLVNEACWVYDKFGDGNYTDILGLCKLATLAEIEEKGWSLTPGAYVGVAPIEDDGIDFATRMSEIHRELLSLQAESNDLMDTISQNMKEIGI